MRHISSGKGWNRICALLFALIMMLSMTACGNTQTDDGMNQESPEVENLSETYTDTVETNMTSEDEVKEGEKEMVFKINDEIISVAWEDNESVKALEELVSADPLTIQMSLYGGFEQVGAIGTNLPRDDVHTTTDAGDIVLYSGNQMVIFYGSNSWAYTRLGKVQDKTDFELAALLGSGDVTITISFSENTGAADFDLLDNFGGSGLDPDKVDF